MDIEIDSKRNNPLLNRTEIYFTIKHEGESTPNRELIRSELADKLNVKKENIIVNTVDSSFGKAEISGYAKIYSSLVKAKEIERDHFLKRNHLIEGDKKPEKKVEEAPAVKPPKEGEKPPEPTTQAKPEEASGEVKVEEPPKELVPSEQPKKEKKAEPSEDVPKEEQVKEDVAVTEPPKQVEPAPPAEEPEVKEDLKEEPPKQEITTEEPVEKKAEPTEENIEEENKTEDKQKEKSKEEETTEKEKT